MQGIADKTSGAMNQAVEYLKSNPRVAAMLLAGGGAGILGGALTAREPERETEGKGSRRLRILRNALLAGGAGAGIVGLGSQGYKNLAEAVPAGTKDPFAEKLTSLPIRTLAGTAGGVAGAGIGGKADVKDFTDQIHSNPNLSFKPKGMTTAELFGAAKRTGIMPTMANNAVTRGAAKMKGVPILKSIIQSLAGSPRALRYGIAGTALGALAPEALMSAKNYVLGE